MKPRNILIILLLVIITIVIVSYFTSSTDEVLKEVHLESTMPPVFMWKYEKDDSFNLDGVPQTNIFLEATYPNGAVETKLIDTTESSCNDLPDSEEDSVLNSTTIQCYGAGLGYSFKITKGENSYFIERKMFEEALPDYDPPLYEYEVVSEFPLTN